ncbi:hypothetical protein GGP69_001352 [Salinibacter ruber]|nr:hypothetical protein [Salinibacter ruber]
MIQQHPHIYMPESVKETMFFDRYYDRGLDWYREYFHQAGLHQICGEVAPTYFDVPEAPDRIHEVSPYCEVFVTLRNPVERARSLYLHHLKKGRVSESFWDAVKQKPRIIEAGHYANHIPRWHSTFGSDQIKILFLSDIQQKPEKVLKVIQNVLGVDHMDPPERMNESVNSTTMPRSLSLAQAGAVLAAKLHKYRLHRVVNAAKRIGLKSLLYSGGGDEAPDLAASTRRKLFERYQSDIAFVEEETGRDLSTWRAQ